MEQRELRMLAAMEKVQSVATVVGGHESRFRAKISRSHFFTILSMWLDNISSVIHSFHDRL